ncbi:hypothetical protein [Aureimonas ureilytica]|uniref:hypothetical protein n=1 Tax=Aureimonas ureilytica TaxID=401562 RepID=UPI000367059B|nr:hypothetical protein [Aureimonas ureilytica]
MLMIEAQETIARFIGLFRVTETDAGLHARLFAGTPHLAKVHPRTHAEDDPPARGPALSAPVIDPDIRLANDRFEIEDVASRRLPPPHVDLAIDPLPLSHFRAPGEVAIPASSAGWETMRPDPDALFLYRTVPSDSLFAIHEQIGLLDDRDTLILDPDADPLLVVAEVTQQFEAMLGAARDFQHLPGIPHTPADLKGLLEREATQEGAEPSAAGAPSGHEGIFVDGEKVDSAPDLGKLVEEARQAPDIGEDQPLLQMGGNLSANQAALLNVGHLGAVTVVEGDWFEVNSIRQLNIHADRDGVEGLGDAVSAAIGDTTRSLNIASFERIDRTPEGRPAFDPRDSLPTRYKVDVIEGNLEIANFLRQVKLTLDGDQVVLSAMESTVRASTGGNESLNVASLSKLLGAYDLVIVGGSVYEGNFIQQINVLNDSDRIVSDASGTGGSVSTSGNLLANNASITNVGGLADFTGFSPEMRALVSAFEDRLAGGDPSLGADLAFLAGRNIKVLYISGDVIETNVISQINLMDDADTLRMADGSLARLANAIAPDAQWTVTTGGNTLLNEARIVDADDAGHVRFLGGEYYSGSMLLQAELVASGPDIQTFDTGTLAPELIAFVSDIHGDGVSPLSDALAHSAASLGHDAPADGVAGILA